MERWNVVVRLVEGDDGGLSAKVTLTHGEQVGKVRLYSGAPSVEWSYEITDEEIQAGRTGYTYLVEYEWGYAREASCRGEAVSSPLILPLPGVSDNASFPFPRRF
ncbi:MAG: hypothetical protein JWN14_3097 [Chthonomonadales bacterium]|nr:hypothetical protein [Chthonomonadales bacterium]